MKNAIARMSVKRRNYVDNKLLMTINYDVDVFTLTIKLLCFWVWDEYKLNFDEFEMTIDYNADQLVIALKYCDDASVTTMKKPSP